MEKSRGRARKGEPDSGRERESVGGRKCETILPPTLENEKIEILKK